MSHNTTLCPVRQALTVDQMLAKNERLVHWVVHRQWLGELRYAAAVQAGRLALWQAVQGYDGGRGTGFSTYAVPAIQRAVWRAVCEAQAPVCEQCWACMPQPAVDPEQALLDRLRDELVRVLVAQLPERLGYVIVPHYGLADEPPQSLAQLGRVLGVTRQRVQQLHREALLWLAQPSRSVALRYWLGRNTRADYQAFLAQQRRWLRRGRRR
jgi:RNA polymerase sigma factor (sigma-70 family)